MPIRVIFLIGELSVGGSERQLYLLLKHLDKAQYEPHVVVFNHPSSVVIRDEALEQVGVTVWHMPPGCRSIPQRMRFLYRLFRRLRPHVVHSWTVHDNPYAEWAGLLARVPVRLGSMRIVLSSEGFRNLPPFFRYLSLHSTQRLVVNADEIRRELSERGLAGDRVVVLHNCVEMEVFGEGSSLSAGDFSSLGIHDGDRLIGMVGNLRSRKNHLMFVEGMAKVLKEFPDVRGLIVGQPIPDEREYPDRIRARIGQLGLHDRVILTGFRDDVTALMSRLSVVCLTSDHEGAPNVILEAMAAARPVVATRIGGAPELVKDGITGILVEPRDEDAFACAVKKILEKPELAEQMGRSGRELVKREFTCNRAAQKLADVYLHALEQKGKVPR